MQSKRPRTRATDTFCARVVAISPRESALANRDANYPAHVLCAWRDADGTIVRFRPITVADAELIREFVRALSFEARYMRFMAAVHELAPQTVDLLTRIDHQRDAALIATAHNEAADRVVGVARYALNADGHSYDFAVVVADDWRRRGLGRHLMTLLVETAAARGLNEIGGDVLAINQPMLAFANALGFGVSASNVPTVRRVLLNLDQRRASA